MTNSEFLFIASVNKENAWELDAPESNHAFKVLRLSTGTSVQVTNGHGKGYIARLGNFSKSGCTLELMEEITPSAMPSSLSLFIAPPKASDRLEWIVEKSVELGVVHFHFITSQRSERRKVNLDRLNSIARSAMKQCKRFHAPVLHPILTIKEAINSLSNPKSAGFATCAPLNESKIPFTYSFNAIFIGPEGDFTPDETRLALTKGLCPVHLGSARLRTETAALTAAFTHYTHYTHSALH
jgi:16S rRNA (uracil1498-N3)-methyltransferase